MSEVVPVTANGTEFYVEISDKGPSNVGINDVLKFDGVRQSIEAITESLTGSWARVKPDEATVEFSLTLKAKEGVLTGLLVSGGAEGALKVTLKWVNEKKQTPDSTEV